MAGPQRTPAGADVRSEIVHTKLRSLPYSPAAYHCSHLVELHNKDAFTRNMSLLAVAVTYAQDATKLQCIFLRTCRGVPNEEWAVRIVSNLWCDTTVKPHTTHSSSISGVSCFISGVTTFDHTACLSSMCDYSD